MNSRLNYILRFIIKNQAKLLILLLVVSLLDYLAKYPYLNVLLVFPYPWNSTIILWGVTAILFRLDERFSFGTALVLLCISMVASIFGKGTFIEMLGNGVYGLLLFGFVQIGVRNIIRHKV